MTKKIIIYAFLFLTIIPKNSFSQKSIDSQKIGVMEDLPLVSAFWRAGEYLIYDCLERSYICVSKDSFTRCSIRRERSKILERNILYCAPLKKYKSYETCLIELYGFIARITDKRFCSNYGLKY